MLEQRGLDAAVFTHLPNVRYLCGFTGSNAALVVSGRETTLFTDPRYEIQAGRECDCRVRIVAGPLFAAVAKKTLRWRRLGLEGAHLAYTKWAEFRSLTKGWLRLRDFSGEVERLRAVKSAEEVAAIRASVELNSKAYAQAVRGIRPEWTEKDLAAEIDHRMRKLGAEGPAFETIVAAGANSALPHARPSGESIGRDRLLLIDMGASLNGYASDMTRVVHMGPPSEQARRIYDAVLEAQLASIEAVKAGATCERVDAAGRNQLKRRKLDRLFTHSTGHGLGLEIHEGPRLGRLSKDVLEAGMVITIEPGVYVEGFGGVRIEDTVVVTETGAEVLTPTKKELQSIT